MSRVILLLLAGSFFLLHSLVAHKHQSENHSDTALAQEMNNSFSSLIEFIFHEDLGSGHLENVVFPQFVGISSNPEIEIPKATIVQIESNLAVVKTEATSFEFTSRDPLRGPPMLG